MRIRSLVGRLALLQQGLAALVILVFAASALWLTQRVLERREDAFLAAMAHRLARNLDLEFREERDLARAARDVLEEESRSGVHIDIRDRRGRLLASSAPVRAPGGAPRGQAPPAPGESVHRAVARSSTGATVETSVSDRLRRNALAALAGALLVSAAPLLLLALLLGRSTAARALRPLAEMEERARNASIERGVRSLGGSWGLEEIDGLRSSFDRLLGRLDDLLQSERRFTADASHELRTPLTVLSGELELALGERSLSPRVRAGLTRASDQVAEMRALVESLLLLRRAGQPAGVGGESFEAVNLSDLAGEAALEARRRHPERSSDIEVAAPDEALVLGQPVLLTSALMNLVENAIKFTRRGETVRIAVEAGSDLAVSVDDAGRGVEAADRERVFDPFFRGAEARAGQAGFGLGLPIIRQVARAHGGDVTAHRSALGGARFTLRLPAWSAGAAPGERSGGSVSARAAGEEDQARRLAGS